MMLVLVQWKGSDTYSHVAWSLYANVSAVSFRRPGERLLTPQVVVKIEKLSSSKTFDSYRGVSLANADEWTTRLTPKSASMSSASSALLLNKMFSGFRSTMNGQLGLEHGFKKNSPL